MRQKKHRRTTHALVLMRRLFALPSLEVLAEWLWEQELGHTTIICSSERALVGCDGKEGEVFLCLQTPRGTLLKAQLIIAPIPCPLKLTIPLASDNRRPKSGQARLRTEPTRAVL